MFKRILIANRGEIALRIIRACRELGIETVAVYSEADQDAEYLKLANKKFCIGPTTASSSYLKIDRIISAAELGEVDAIHPGYGLLAENAHFADVCRSCGYEFIGPSVAAMEQLGDKISARAIAKRGGVPTVPGSDGEVADVEQAEAIANSIGYPVLLKATAGGGGRGMRVVREPGQLRTAFEQAASEAKANFGNGALYLEKFVEGPRHIEAQIIADRFGNVCHLWERDCSTQRRHQKLVEESPAPNLSQKTRTALCNAAAAMARESGYTSAGTVEFIVDRDENFYFIEMNTRIQVEHPVTELVTGIDLIKTQILLASGEKLPFTQKDVKQRGHALECRINAEDCDHNFRPAPGLITQLIVPGGFGVRFDSHVYSGYTVSPYYDSMVGKLIVHQPTREEAIKCMLRCLDEIHISGIKTSIPLQKKILSHPDFMAGQVDTSFIEQNFMK
ncbi:MAG: acetyl-CoA carboxylase biotin carboxylase subunit [Planctomycetia bacterium]|nr:acetyl-CoA carboxylase biotin carboxylase subunit [Planctomycetia bacterium]